MAQLAVHVLAIVPERVKAQNLAVVQEELPELIVVLLVRESILLWLVAALKVLVSRHAFRRIQGDLKGLRHVLFCETVTADNAEGLSVKGQLDAQIKVRGLKVLVLGLGKALALDEHALGNAAVLLRWLHD